MTRPSASHAETSPRESLEYLLLDIFEPREFRRHVRLGPQGEDVTAKLPIDSTPEDLVHRAVGVLDQRGLLDVAFFDRLAATFPGRVSEIDACRDVWLAVDGQRRTGLRPGGRAGVVALALAGGVVVALASAESFTSPVRIDDVPVSSTSVMKWLDQSTDLVRTLTVIEGRLHERVYRGEHLLVLRMVEATETGDANVPRVTWFGATEYCHAHASRLPTPAELSGMPRIVGALEWANAKGRPALVDAASVVSYMDPEPSTVHQFRCVTTLREDGGD